MAKGDFLNFRNLVTTTLIKAVYGWGAALITVASLAVVVWPFVFYDFDALDFQIRASAHVLAGLCSLIFANLLWRLLCEAWIIAFSIHEMLAALEKNLATTAALLETVSRQIHGVETNTELRHAELISVVKKSP